MKRCPTCQRTFTDDTQKFCANDGTPLVNDEPAFDPEATVMSLSSQLASEEPSSPSPPSPQQPPPNPYYSPGAGSPSTPEQNVHQSYPPPSPPSPGALPNWQPPQPQPQQQQPYYPQPGAMPGAQTPPQQWQGGQQQPPWMPPGQQQPQGQNWNAGASYYPQQQGHPTPQAGKSAALGLASLITGILGFINWALLFGMYFRILPPDRSAAEIIVYVMLILSILAALLGVVTMISSRARSKALGIIGLLLGLPGIIFFIYLAAEGRLP